MLKKNIEVVVFTECCGMLFEWDWCERLKGYKVITYCLPTTHQFYKDKGMGRRSHLNFIYKFCIKTCS